MTEAQLKKIMTEVADQSNAALFGQLVKHFDEKHAARVDPLEAKIDTIRSTSDAEDKRIAADQAERAAMNAQLERHDGWIGQSAKGADIRLSRES